MATAKKPAAKKTAAKPAKKAATRVGSGYSCTDCGLVVVVNEDCGCATVDLVCCGTPMKKKRAACKK
jgi:hypothetical protein